VKRVIYEDRTGRVNCRLLRDIDDANFPEIGVPVEPPPIERIVMESAIEIRNELVRNGILTYRDLNEVQNQGIVTQVLNSTLRRKIVEAYKLKELENNESK
jgi:hypothetical protein